MLEIPFRVPSLCKLNPIKVCFIQISRKITCKYLISFRESHVFLKVIPGFFGPLGKFQHNRFLLKRPVLPNYLSVSCNYGGIFHNGISYHIYQHLTYPMVISNVKLLTLDWILKVPLTLSDYWVQMNTVTRNDFQKQCRFQLNSIVWILSDCFYSLFPMSEFNELQSFRIILSDTSQVILLQPVESNMKTK